MLNIGRKQKLVVVKKVEFGIYLGETREAGEKERVLLPIKQVPEGTKEGDELEVFLYRDSSDRLIATTREPKLVLGELAVLNVAATGKIGPTDHNGLYRYFESVPKKLVKSRRILPLAIKRLSYS